MAVPAAKRVPATMVVPRRYAPARERSVPSLARSIRAGTSTTKGKALSFHTDVTGSSNGRPSESRQHHSPSRLLLHSLMTRSASRE